MANLPSTPSSASSMATQQDSTEEAIDLNQTEAIDLNQTEALLLSKNVFIPSSYLKRMVKNDILEDLLATIECESESNDRIQRILAKHRICIPMQYFYRLVRNNLIESLLKLVHDVNCEEQITLIQYSKRSYEFSDLNEKARKRYKTLHTHTPTNTDIDDIQCLSDDNEQDN